MNNKPPQRVIVFCLSGLGDAILASPALVALAANPDRFKLTLLTMFGSVTEYLRDQRFADDVRLEKLLGMSKRAIFRAAWSLRREQFDISIVPYAMNRLGYNVFSRVVGAKQRIGFRYQRQSVINLPSLNQVVIDENPALHAVEENLRWASLLTGVDAKNLTDELHYRYHASADTVAEDYLRLHKLDSAIPLIGIHAACNSLKNQHRRCWPASRFGEFIQQMHRNYTGARFILFEGPTDVEINNAVLAATGSANGTINVAKMLPMRVVAALIRRCQLFVSNDSGLMHTAAACNVPVVGVYGPTDSTWDKPWKTKSIVVTRGLSCSPCFYYSSRPLDCPAKLDYACVRKLPVADVERAALSLL
jgi:heptosyltransferase II